MASQTEEVAKAQNWLASRRMRVERAWSIGTTPWWLGFAGSVLAMVLAMTAALLWSRFTDQEAIVRLQIQAAQESLDRRARASPAEFAPAPTDFTQRLPDAVDIQAVVATVQLAAIEAGVTFSGMQLQPRAATPDLLSRNDLMLSLRGSHPKLKQVLAEVLGRYPNATLSHLTLRRIGAPEQVEAAMVIGVWGAPMAAGALAPATEAR